MRPWQQLVMVMKTCRQLVMVVYEALAATSHGHEELPAICHDWSAAQDNCLMAVAGSSDRPGLPVCGPGAHTMPCLQTDITAYIARR